MLLLSVLSCERETDIPLKPGTGRLYLECFPSNGHDTTYISLTAARPVTDLAAPGRLSGIRMDFSVNGESAGPELYSVDNDTYTYMADFPIETGDRISVSASAEGYPSVSATSEVPVAPEIEMDREIYRYGTLRHRFTVRRDGGPGRKRYYGVAITGERRMETVYADPDMEPVTEVSRLQYDYGMSSPVESTDEDILGYETITQCRVNGMNMAVFEDDGGNTPELEIVVDIPYEKDKYWVVTEEYSTYRRTLYRVDMFLIPEQAYEYLNPKVNESLLAAGLIPPFINRGNVSGGYGTVSCMGCTSSGWIGSPESRNQYNDSADFAIPSGWSK